MQDEINSSLKISIELLVAAVFITFVIIICSTSYRALAVKNNYKVADKYILEYKEISKYDDKTINGSDIPSVILKYIRYYDFEINIDGTIYKIDTNEEKTQGKKIWTTDYIVNTLLGNEIYNKYKSKVIRDTYDIASGIRFTKE